MYQYNKVVDSLINGIDQDSFLNGTKYDWLIPFKDSFDQQLKSALNSPPLSDSYSSNVPEDMLGDVSQLVDRCLAYRRQYFDLEQVAIRRALDYQLFSQQTPILKSLELSGETDKVKSELVEDKYRCLGKYQDALMARHDAPGSSLNFPERMLRLMSFVRDDIKLAYTKATIVQMGLKACYGIDTQVPDPNSDGFFDNFVVWTRDIISSLNAVLLREIQFSLVVPGVGQAGSDCFVQVGLKSKLASRVSNLRLRGVSASITGGPKPAPSGISIAVFPPTFPGTPPIFMQNVCPLSSPFRPSVYTPYTARNTSVAGVWRIKLQYLPPEDVVGNINFVLFINVAATNRMVAGDMWTDFEFQNSFL